MSAKQSIYESFLNGTLANKTIPEICKLTGIPYKEKKRLQSVLDELCKDGVLYCSDGGRYGTMEQLGLIKGKINGNERGFAFLIPEDKELYPSDFFLPPKALNGAYHGDTVLAQRTYGEKGDEAQVVKI